MQEQLDRLEALLAGKAAAPEGIALPATSAASKQ